MRRAGISDQWSISIVRSIFEVQSYLQLQHSYDTFSQNLDLQLTQLERSPAVHNRTTIEEVLSGQGVTVSTDLTGGL